MSKQKEEEDADVADTNNEEEEDDNHAEATEILTNLLQNHQALPTYDDAAPPAAGVEGASSSVTEGQQAAIQQMIQQLKLGGVALPNGATVAAVANGGEQGEKKHAFWDTQVRRMRLREGEINWFAAMWSRITLQKSLHLEIIYHGASRILPISHTH